ncbi:hypothetical protein Tco_1210385 [Tanacetum coccineum]
MTTPTNNSQMHNNIMAVGSKDRPPMLATGRYAQWRSRFLRYVDTKSNKQELKQCIFDGLYVMTEVIIHVKPATATQEAVPEHTVPETYGNTTPEKLDTCTTTKEMWIPIERLQQGESLNKQDVKIILFWEFGKFTSRDGKSIESYYLRFYKMMNEMIRFKLEASTMQILTKNHITSFLPLNECKYDLEESNDIRDRCRSALRDREIELEKCKKYINCQREKEEVEHKYKESLEKNDELVHKSSLEHTQYDLLRKEKEQLKKDFKISQDKDTKKLIDLENQVKFLNDIVYKTNQSVQTIHTLAPNLSSYYNGRASFMNPKYLKKDQSEKPCLYKVSYDKDDLANIFAPNCDETLILEEESISKLDKEKIKHYDYTYQNSLYELFTPQTQKSLDQLYFANEIRMKMWRKSFVKYKPNIVKNIGFLPTQASLSKSRHTFNVVQYNITNFKTIIDLDWQNRLDNRLNKPITHEITMLVKNLLMPLTIKTKENENEFERALKQEMFKDLKYVQSLKKEVDELESGKADFSNEYDLLLQECVSKDIMCAILRSFDNIDEYSGMACDYLEAVAKCERLKNELSKRNENVENKSFNELT